MGFTHRLEAQSLFSLEDVTLGLGATPWEINCFSWNKPYSGIPYEEDTARTLKNIPLVIHHMHHYEAELFGQSSYERRYWRLLRLFGELKEAEVSTAHKVS